MPDAPADERPQRSPGGALALLLALLVAVATSLAATLVLVAAVGRGRSLLLVVVMAALAAIAVPGMLARSLTRLVRRRASASRRVTFALWTLAVLQAGLAVGVSAVADVPTRALRATAERLWRASRGQRATTPSGSGAALGSGSGAAPGSGSGARPTAAGGARSGTGSRSNAARADGAPPFVPGQRVPGWPRTSGIAWELDPRRALARARRERKPVLVYVGSHGCPHCRRMEAREWADPAVIAAVKRVVLLAAHRYGEGGRPSAMAVRLNVQAYPQLRYLDGWGRPLGVKVVRNARQLAGSVDRALEALRAVRPPGPRALSPPLAREVPAVRRAELTAGDTLVRSTAWVALLRAGKLSAAALAALFAAERDATVRLSVIHALRGARGGGATAAQKRVIGQALADDNDWVRSAGLAAAARGGAKEHRLTVQRLLVDLNALRIRVANRNNLRAAAIRALGAIGDARTIPLLEATADQVCGGTNICCRLTLEAAHDLWRADRSVPAARVWRRSLGKVPAGRLHRVTARDARLALRLIGEAEGKRLAPTATTEAALRKAIARALRR